MKIKELLEGVDFIEINKINDIDFEVQGLNHDSSKIVEGDLFFCINGKNLDGHDYAITAVKNGAVAIVVERKLDLEICQILVKNTRKAMSLIASNFYDNPSKKLKIIGVTGTNGKTTIVNFISYILTSVGKNVGQIGTLGIKYSGVKKDENCTTPDPIILHKIFKDMVDKGIKIVVMEVSAHALALHKLEGIKFEIGIFTNLTQDHLDFFENMDAYKNAKKEFFTNKYCQFCIINVDDKVGLEILRDIKLPYCTYGLYNPADTFAVNIEECEKGIKFVLNFFDDIRNIELKFGGIFNVYNTMAVATAVAILGVSCERIAKLLTSFKGVEGRIEKLKINRDYSVFIDYAHTPDGLENILKSLKNICNNRLICVFGCGGNRDKTKRKIMGEISAKNADFTIITSDNPRYEEPLDIIDDIERGVNLITKQYISIQSRQVAIKYALDMAKMGDIIVIAGKGAENYQEIMGIKHPYNDKNTVISIL